MKLGGRGQLLLLLCSHLNALWHYLAQLESQQCVKAAPGMPLHWASPAHTTADLAEAVARHAGRDDGLGESPGHLVRGASAAECHPAQVGLPGAHLLKGGSARAASSLQKGEALHKQAVHMACLVTHTHVHCMPSSELPLFGCHLQVDEQFRQLMAATEANSLVVRFAETPRIQVRGFKQSIALACIRVPCTQTIGQGLALQSISSTLMGMR